MNPYKRFNSKLYNPRDIEGNPNLEMFKAVDIIHEALIEEEDFVAVEPFGSKIMGYSHEHSDFDIRILVDIKDKMNYQNIDDIEEILKSGSEVHHRTEELKEKALQALQDRGFNCDKLHILIFTVSKNENTQRIQNGLTKDEDDANIVGTLFKIFKGKRINELRDSAITELKKLPENKRLRQVQLMAEALSKSELQSFTKIQQRTKDVQDYDVLFEDRIQMWKNRILGFID